MIAKLPNIDLICTSGECSFYTSLRTKCYTILARSAFGTNFSHAWKKCTIFSHVGCIATMESYYTIIMYTTLTYIDRICDPL